MRLILCAIFLLAASAYATPSTSPEILARRGQVARASSEEHPEEDTKPTLTLEQPDGGWSSSMMIPVKGHCSDASVDPIEINLNGTRYYSRNNSGDFGRKFPAAPGKNTIEVVCANSHGAARVSQTVQSVISPIALKLVLTGDTDDVYTDLHIYEPDGTHVYWAQTNSPSGGIFFLNNDGEGFDSVGYGPYLFVHPAPPVGVYRVDTNYWPGGAVQHTLATLDVVLNEGSADENRTRVRAPLAHPDETRTLAYVVVRPNHAPVKMFVPGQDADSNMPQEVRDYKRLIEPKILEQQKKEESGEDYAYLQPNDEVALRESLTRLALLQSRKLSPLWDPQQRDCAGLVRFSYREGLRARSAEQLDKLGVPRKLSLPAVSLLGRHIFPQYPRIWQAGIDPAEFNDFADAETLVGYNFVRTGLRPDQVEAGDLLVYRKDVSSDEPWHLMLAAPNGQQPLFVYHNGASGSEAAVRVVSLGDLEHSPDPTWLPLSNNPNFLGVYQWKRFRPRDVRASSLS